MSSVDQRTNMHQHIAFLVSFVVALAACADADDCRPEKNEAHAWQCCKHDKGTVPESFAASVKKCMGQNPPMAPKPTGPPSDAAMKEMHQMMECSAECVFTENGLLTGDKTIDKTNVVKVFKDITKDDKEMDAAMTTAIDKCLTTYMADVDASAKCKSGAMQLEKCIMREGFINCPRSKWTSSDECSKLKTKVAKCPKMPVMMMPPPTRMDS